jgi:hypothetical protein
MNQYTQERNKCDSCEILNYTTCPLFERAVDKGLDGLSECEMSVSISRLVTEVKRIASWRPKIKEEATA